MIGRTYCKFEEWNRDPVGQIGHSVDPNIKGKDMKYYIRETRSGTEIVKKQN